MPFIYAIIRRCGEEAPVSVINFIDNHLAASYFVFVLVAVIGLLQLVAVHRKLVGLSLIPSTRRRLVGYLLGLTLTLGSFPVFFVVQQIAILKPGLAGFELLILFSGATLSGLVLTLVGAALVQRDQGAVAVATATLPSGVRRQELDLGHETATLYLPSGAGPWPALCAIGDPDSTSDAFLPLAHALVHGGYAVLLLHPDRETAWRYPEVLALAPRACTLLARRDDIAGDRIALLGHGLGADLALRSGSTDEQVRAVIALAPLLDQAGTLTGLEGLREMTLPQALSWSRFRSDADLVGHLAPLEHSARANGGTDILFVYGTDDGLIDAQKALRAVQQAVSDAQFKTCAGQDHTSLLCSGVAAEAILRWLKGRL